MSPPITILTVYDHNIADQEGVQVLNFNLPQHVKSMYSFRTSVHILLVTDNSLTHRAVQLILPVVQLTSATDILNV